jgi:hypothetical protein
MSIAIIGGGTTGIFTAFYLVRNGFKDITIFEKEEELGGRVTSKNYANGNWEHCERAIVPLMFNAMDSLKHLGALKNFAEIHSEKRNSPDISLILPVIKIAFFTIFGLGTFSELIKNNLSKQQLDNFVKFIELWFYVKDVQNIKNQFRGLLFLMIFARSSIDSLNLLSISGFAKESIAQPAKKYLCSHGVKFKLGKSVRKIKKDTTGSFRINGQNFKYVFVTLRLSHLAKIEFESKKQNETWNKEYIEKANTASNYNAPVIYHMKLKGSDRVQTSRKLIGKTLDSGEEHLLYKTDINYIFYTINKSSPLATKDFTIKELVQKCNEILPGLLSSQIQFVKRKNNNDIGSSVYIGEPLDTSHISNIPNLFVAGSYSDCYISESTETAALSAKLAVHKLVVQNSWFLWMIFWVPFAKWFHLMAATLNLV